MNSTKPKKDLKVQNTEMIREHVEKRSSSHLVLWFVHTTACGILLTLGIALLVLQVIQVSQQPSDFCQDYFAAQRLIQGIPIYQLIPSSAHCIPGFSNFDAHPPSSVLLVFPFGYWSYKTASLLWGLILLAAYLTSGVLLLRALNWFSLRGLALFVIGSAYWQPLIGAEADQNFFQLLLLLLVIAWLLERRASLTSSGGLLGLAWLLKLWSSALLLSALVRRRWRQAAAGGLTIVLGTAITVGILGPGAYASYLGPVQAEEAFWVASNGNMSIEGVITRLFAGDLEILPPVVSSGVTLQQAVLLGEAIAGLLLLGAVAFIGWCHWHVSHEPVELLTQGFLVTITSLTFPLTWFFAFIILLLPFATTILALRLIPKPSLWWFCAVGLGLLPLIAPDMSLSLGAWFLDHHIAGAAWWANFAFALPVIGECLFASAQGYLLWSICRKTLAGRISHN